MLQFKHIVIKKSKTCIQFNLVCRDYNLDVNKVTYNNLTVILDSDFKLIENEEIIYPLTGR